MAFLLATCLQRLEGLDLTRFDDAAWQNKEQGWAQNNAFIAAGPDCSRDLHKNVASFDETLDSDAAHSLS